MYITLYPLHLNYNSMKLAGIELVPKINVNKVDLFLNGAAIRSKFFIQTYIISLYAATPIRDEKTELKAISRGAFACKSLLRWLHPRL